MIWRVLEKYNLLSYFNFLVFASYYLFCISLLKIFSIFLPFPANSVLGGCSVKYERKHEILFRIFRTFGWPRVLEQEVGGPTKISPSCPQVNFSHHGFSATKNKIKIKWIAPDNDILMKYKNGYFIFPPIFHFFSFLPDCDIRSYIQYIYGPKNGFELDEKSVNIFALSRRWYV